MYSLLSSLRENSFKIPSRNPDMLRKFTFEDGEFIYDPESNKIYLNVGDHTYSTDTGFDLFNFIKEDTPVWVFRESFGLVVNINNQYSLLIFFDKDDGLYGLKFYVGVEEKYLTEE